MAKPELKAWPIRHPDGDICFVFEDRVSPAQTIRLSLKAAVQLYGELGELLRKKPS